MILYAKKSNLIDSLIFEQIFDVPTFVNGEQKIQFTVKVSIKAAISIETKLPLLSSHCP